MPTTPEPAERQPPWARRTEGGWSIAVLVVPGASRTEVVGEHDGRLRVRVAAPPSGGAANRALVRHLADLLGLARRDVRIDRGGGARAKVVLVPADVDLGRLPRG